MSLPSAEALSHVDELFRARIAGDAPGAALAVLSAGEVVAEHYYGMADLAQAVPFSSRSVIRIGSQTKQFVAYVALRLEQEGVLSLDDAVGDYLRWPPEAVKRVRLRSLASHTSGVRDFLDLMVLFGVSALGPVSRGMERDIIAASLNLAAPEGASLLYSNSNFLLLQDVVEAAARRPLEDLLLQYVTGPLGMSDTRLLWRDDQWTARLAGHHRRGAKGDFLRGTSLAAIGGEGGLVSTLPDMVRWIRHLRASSEAGDGVVRAMETSVALGTGALSPAGLGLIHTRHGGIAGIGHGGSVVGGRSEAVRFPVPDLAIIVLANREDLPVFALIRECLDILLSRPSAAQLPESMVEAFQGMAGEWREENGGRFLMVSADADRAYLTTSMGRVPLAPRPQALAAPLMALPPLCVSEVSRSRLTVDRWGRAADFIPLDPLGAGADIEGRYRAPALDLVAEIDGRDADMRLRLVSRFGLCRARLERKATDLFLALPESDDQHERWLVSPWNPAWVCSLWFRPGGFVLNTDQTADIPFDRC